jgi:xanthine dehydrogenase YagS FAD-binding subunit
MSAMSPASQLPKMPATARSAYLKHCENDSFDWLVAEFAVAIDVDPDEICRKASIILGAAAPVPHRTRNAEAVLVGPAIDSGAAEAASQAAVGDAKPLSGNAYKLPIFHALVRRAVLRAAQATCRF